MQDLFSRLHHPKRHRPRQRTLQLRRELIRAVEQRLNRKFSPREGQPGHGYKLEPFGSTAYGLDTDKSDLDLCVIDPKRHEGFRSALDLKLLKDNGLQVHMPEGAINSTDDEAFDASKDDGTATGLEEPRAKGEGRSNAKNSAKARNASPPTFRRPLDPIYDIRNVARVIRAMGFHEVIPIPFAGVPIVKFVDHRGIKADIVSPSQIYKIKQA